MTKKRNKPLTSTAIQDQIPPRRPLGFLIMTSFNHSTKKATYRMNVGILSTQEFWASIFNIAHAFVCFRWFRLVADTRSCRWWCWSSWKTIYLGWGEPIITDMKGVDHECYLQAPQYCDFQFPTLQPSNNSVTFHPKFFQRVQSRTGGKRNGGKASQISW